MEISPSYEPTTMSIIAARRSSRNFTVLIVVAALVAIVVGVGVGYLIVGGQQSARTAAPKADPTEKPR
jgi:hypothetical protein